LCSSQAAEVRWRTHSIQWGRKGPKAAAWWGAYESWGSRPRDTTQIIMASTEACLSMGRDSLFLLQPLSGGFS